MARQLLFDVTELAKFDKRTGIQRVTRALLNSLDDIKPAGWSVVAVRGDDASGTFVVVPSLLTPKCLFCAENESESAVSVSAGDVFLSVDLTYNISTKLRSELTKFRGQGVGVYFVVYDFIPLRYPEWFHGTNAWFEGNDYLKLFTNWVDCVVEEADGLVCISNAVSIDVADWLSQHQPRRVDQPRLGYFHLGSDLAASLPSAGLPSNVEEVVARLKAKTTFLMVGTLEPRKGHAFALDALEILWDRGVDINLVFVGKAGWKVDSLLARIRSHEKLTKNLFWLEGISDEYLREIYGASDALLALSLAEGFGLPLVEAAHHGVSLIARRIPVFEEVCGSAATYFDGSTGNDLAQLLADWIARREAGEDLTPTKMRLQTWRGSADQLIEVIRKLSGDVTFWRAVQ